MNKDCEMELSIGCPTINTKRSPYTFFNQHFLHQTFLLDINSVKAFPPKKWFNHSNGKDRPFQMKLN